MMDTSGSIDPRRLAEAVREACLDAALAGYESAALSGLCCEGAWEVAIEAIRSLDVARLSGGRLEVQPPTNRGLRDATRGLADRFASSGPPAAGSAAAAIGAIASGLLEWAAALSERRGPTDFRKRAHTIARRASVLRAGLASAGEEDAKLVRALFQPDVSADGRRGATGSLLEIATRCAQTVTLAAEVVALGHRAIRPDVEAALRMAWTAAECALDLVEENLRSDADEGWALDAKRRAWRARLLLQRAAPLRRAGETGSQAGEVE